jgi:hypothetical protein
MEAKGGKRYKEEKGEERITIIVPIVYMGRDELIFFYVGYIHFDGHWKGWALKIKTFLGPEMAMSEASAFGPKKPRFSGPTPSHGLNNGPSQNSTGPFLWTPSVSFAMTPLPLPILMQS